MATKLYTPRFEQEDVLGASGSLALDLNDGPLELYPVSPDSFTKLGLFYLVIVRQFQKGEHGRPETFWGRMSAMQLIAET